MGFFRSSGKYMGAKSREATAGASKETNKSYAHHFNTAMAPLLICDIELPVIQMSLLMPAFGLASAALATDGNSLATTDKRPPTSTQLSTTTKGLDA